MDEAKRKNRNPRGEPASVAAKATEIVRLSTDLLTAVAKLVHAVISVLDKFG